MRPSSFVLPPLKEGSHLGPRDASYLARLCCRLHRRTVFAISDDRKIAIAARMVARAAKNPAQMGTLSSERMIPGIKQMPMMDTAKKTRKPELEDKGVCQTIRFQNSTVKGTAV